MTFVLQLPIPHSNLSPNRRCHWAIKAPLVKAARAAANREARRVLSDQGVEPPRWQSANLTATLFSKGKRRLDPDNFIASLKPYIDGIQDSGIVVNDSELWPEKPIYKIDKKMPRIELAISES